MRSIANGEAEKVENQIDVIPVVQPGALVEGAVDVKDSKESQEETMIAAESDEAIRQTLLGLFPNDRQARDLVDGILAGYEGEGLRTLTDLDQKGYASKRRLVRRTIDKHHPTWEEVMTDTDKKRREALGRLVEVLVEDVLDASDEEILAEFTETRGDPAKNSAEMRALFKKSVLKANKDRLRAARVAVGGEPRGGTHVQIR